MTDAHYTIPTGRARELAEAHANWLFDFIPMVGYCPRWLLRRFKAVYVSAFVHAYKHGVEDATEQE